MKEIHLLMLFHTQIHNSELHLLHLRLVSVGEEVFMLGCFAQVMSEMKLPRICVTVLSGMIFFFFFSGVLVCCDFNVAEGSEGTSQTLAKEAPGNQKDSCRLELSRR